MSEELGKELDWEDQIENDGTDFEPIPDGIYEFEVRSMERGRFSGSEKIAACNKAVLDLVVKDEKGDERHIFDDLLLNSKFEWKLSQFFISIGQKKKGEALKPNWNAVPGATGKVKIYINDYKTKEGISKRNNKVEQYLPCEAKQFKAGDF